MRATRVTDGILATEGIDMSVASTRISVILAAGAAVGDFALLGLPWLLGVVAAFFAAADSSVSPQAFEDHFRGGGNFAKAYVDRECVVTGGAGTIMVTYKGQSYWVCCTGCRDLFNEDPEKVLAEYRARKETEKKKQK